MTTDAPAAPDPAAQAALERLADIAMPPPVSWLPQTWGWAALGVLALAATAWAFLRWRRRRAANRYRVEALAELALLRDVAGIPPLLKRTALAAWPREEVAKLSGGQWVAFLKKGGEVPEALERLLDDHEYRRAIRLSPEQAGICTAAAKRWIEGHRVSA